MKMTWKIWIPFLAFLGLGSGCQSLQSDTTLQAAPLELTTQLQAPSEANGQRWQMEATLFWEPSNLPADGKVVLAQGAFTLLENLEPATRLTLAENGALVAHVDPRRRSPIHCRLAVPVEAKGELFSASLLPASEMTSRWTARVPANLEASFPRGICTAQTENAGGKEYQVHFAQGAPMVMTWKPEAQKLEGDAVASCSVESWVEIRGGQMISTQWFQYRVVQGLLENLRIELPEGQQLVKVQGSQIRAWEVQEEAGVRVLEVTLMKGVSDRLVLELVTEHVLSALPVDVEFHPAIPLDVIRGASRIFLATSEALRLQVDAAGTAMQAPVDRLAEELGVRAAAVKSTAWRTRLAYVAPTLPGKLQLRVDAVEPVLDLSSQWAGEVQSGLVSMIADVELDVREAGLQELACTLPADWLLLGVTGENVADYLRGDVQGDTQPVTVLFRSPVLGRQVIRFQLEQKLTDDAAWSVPELRVDAARHHRGFVVLGAERGIHLRCDTPTGVREVRPGSLPIQMNGAQLGFRFKEAGWKIPLTMSRANPEIFSETFLLAKVNPGLLQGSVVMALEIAGAPLRELRLNVPDEWDNVHLTGPGVRSSETANGSMVVKFQEPVFGSAYLHLTFDQREDSQGKFPLRSLGMESVRWHQHVLVITGDDAMQLAGDPGLGDHVRRLERNEIPEGYDGLIHEHVIAAFQWSGDAATGELAIQRNPTAQPLSLLGEYTRLESRINSDGEIIHTCRFYVKNSGEQFFRVGLPEGATLWPVQVEGRSVSVLKGDDASILIPLPRMHSPEAAALVEIPFTVQGSEPGGSGTYSLLGPLLLEPTGTLAWTVTAPEDMRIHPAAEKVDRTGAGIGPGGMWVRAQRALSDVFSNPDWRIPLAAFGFVSLLLGWTRVRARPWGAACLLVSILAIATALLVLGTCWESASSDTGYLTSSSTVELQTPVQVREALLQTSLILRPDWMGIYGSTAWFATGIALVVLGLVMAFLRRLRRLAGPVFLAGILVGLSAMELSAVVAGCLLAAAVLFLGDGLLFRVAMLAASGTRSAARSAPPMPPELPALPPLPSPSGADGFVRLPMLLTVLSGSLALLGALAHGEDVVDPKPAPPPVTVRAESVHLKGQLRPSPMDPEQVVAELEWEFDLRADAAGKLALLPAQLVVLDRHTPEHVRIITEGSDYAASFAKAGSGKVRFKVITPVQQQGASYSLSLPLVRSARQSADVQLPTGQWTFGGEGIAWVKQEELATGVLLHLRGDGSEMMKLRWEPRIKDVAEEEAKVSAEVHTVVRLEEGGILSGHHMLLNVFQGRQRHFRWKVAPGTRILAMEFPGLFSWRHLENENLVEAVFDPPVAGPLRGCMIERTLAQQAPYAGKGSIPLLEKAELRPGILAYQSVSSLDLLEATAADAGSFSPSDFPQESLVALRAAEKEFAAGDLKRAFRLTQPAHPWQARVALTLPDIRVTESSQFDISDSRNLLRSDLQVQILKVGVFSLAVEMPAGFDLEHVEGKAVDQWEEEVSGERRILRLMFAQRQQGTLQFQLALSRRNVVSEGELDMPRLQVSGATRHTGILILSAETGRQLSVVEEKGLKTEQPRAHGIRHSGALAFRIVEPDWGGRIRISAGQPHVTLETVTAVHIGESSVEKNAWLNLTVERMGVDQLTVVDPEAHQDFRITGDKIARVQAVEGKPGAWLVQFREKILGPVQLRCATQILLKPDVSEWSAFTPQVPEAQGLSSYVLLGADPSVEPMLKRSDSWVPAEARSIPPHHMRLDPASVLRCYRSVAAGAPLELQLVRHGRADQLPLTVEAVRISTLVSVNGGTLNRVLYSIVPGRLRSFAVTLPGGATLWSASVNGRNVLPQVQGDALSIALGAGEGTREVELIYAAKADQATFPGPLQLTGPRTDSPLNNIGWQLFLPEDFRYQDLTGNLDGNDLDGEVLPAWDETGYVSQLEEARNGILQSAASQLNQGRHLLENGEVEKALRALEDAVQLSAAEESMNEDARVQLLNAVKSRVRTGFIERQESLRHSMSYRAGVELEDSPDAGFAHTDARFLDQVAESCWRRQASQVAQRSALHAQLPEMGRRLVFQREVLIEKGGTLEIGLTSVRTSVLREAHLPGLAGLLVLLVVGTWCWMPKAVAKEQPGDAA